METLSTTEVEELYFENRYVSVCGLVNPRTSTLRIIDFRAGPHADKRAWLMDTIRQRRIRRAFSLVEREEVSCWIRLGFKREGAIPAFYKRSDAYVMGGEVNFGLDDLGLTPNPTGRAPDYGRAVADGEPARLYQRARRLAKETPPSDISEIRVQPARSTHAKKALRGALTSGRALTAFDRFGRDVERLNYVCTGRGGFSLLASVESQACYSNSFVELLTPPRTPNEAQLTASAIGALCVELENKGMVSCFSLTPLHNTDLAVAFLANGFRRTGFLQGHFGEDGQRTPAFLWSRKLAALDSPAMIDAGADAA